jgi:hypothetical protein
MDTRHSAVREVRGPERPGRSVATPMATDPTAGFIAVSGGSQPGSSPSRRATSSESRSMCRCSVPGGTVT